MRERRVFHRCHNRVRVRRPPRTAVGNSDVAVVHLLDLSNTLTSECQVRLCPTSGNDVGSVLRSSKSITGEMRELGEIFRAEVRQLVLRPVRPQELHGIEFWCIGGEPFDLDGSVGRVDVIAHQAAAVRRQSVSDDEQLALQLRSQLLEELHDLRPAGIAPGTNLK
jgi:hypothetical protein